MEPGRGGLGGAPRFAGRADGGRPGDGPLSGGRCPGFGARLRPGWAGQHAARQSFRDFVGYYPGVGARPCAAGILSSTGRKANAREEASVSPSLQGCSRWWIGTVPNQGGSAFRAVHLPAGIFRSASTPAWVTYPSGEFWRTWRIGQESLTAVLSVKATKSTISFRIGR